MEELTYTLIIRIGKDGLEFGFRCLDTLCQFVEALDQVDCLAEVDKDE